MKRARSTRLDPRIVIVSLLPKVFFPVPRYNGMRVAITVKRVSLRVDVINAAPILRVNHAAMHANALITARTFNIRLDPPLLFHCFFQLLGSISVISNRDNRTNPLEHFLFDRLS